MKNNEVIWTGDPETDVKEAKELLLTLSNFNTNNLEKAVNKDIALTAVKILLNYIGEDSSREGLVDTPKRFLKAWENYWGVGYNQDPKDVLKVFEDGANNYDEMVLVKDIPIYSHCEHHIAPIIGKCHIAYVPNGKIVGLSKLARLADVFARRLQVQERLTADIATALQKELDPIGVAVVIEAEHLCMSSRGVEKQGSTTTTSKLMGCFKDNSDTRAEFMRLIK